MRIQTSYLEDSIVLIEVEGDVDASTAAQLDTTLKALLAQGCSRLVLDASRIGFISSAGLRAIVFAHRQAASMAGQLRVCRLPVETHRVFQVAGLDECLHIAETCQESIAGW